MTRQHRENEVDRPFLVRRAMTLEYFTVGYNLIEGLVSLVLAGRADSIALIGFGLDSFVESLAGVVVLRRFREEAMGETDHALAEARALKFVGWSFFLLGAYIGLESVRKLWVRERPDPSIAGIVLSLLSLVVMPVLARRKYRTGQALVSSALIADSKETLACVLLSLTLLLGLGLNLWLGWWWADPVAGLTMIPWLWKEGREALEGGSH